MNKHSNSTKLNNAGRMREWNEEDVNRLRSEDLTNLVHRKLPNVNVNFQSEGTEGAGWYAHCPAYDFSTFIGKEWLNALDFLTMLEWKSSTEGLLTLATQSSDITAAQYIKLRNRSMEV